MSAGLAAALMGDDVFFDLIDRAGRERPNSFGVNCSCCDDDGVDTYYVGDLEDGPPWEARCPVCGSTRGGMESPALGHGPAAIQTDHDGSGPVIAALIYGDQTLDMRVYPVYMREQR